MLRLARLTTGLMGIVGLWLIDVGDLARGEGVARLCNGLWCLETLLVFHLGLYLAMASLWLLLVLAEVER